MPHVFWAAQSLPNITNGDDGLQYTRWVIASALHQLQCPFLKSQEN
jgi:hypothetical protein